jgi:hypothetical protein
MTLPIIKQISPELFGTKRCLEWLIFSCDYSTSCVALSIAIAMVYSVDTRMVETKMRKMITRVDPLYDAGMSEKRLICQPTESIRVCVHSLYRLLWDLAKAHMKRERLSTGLSHSKTIFPSCHVIWGSHYCLSGALLEIALINERHFI